MIGMSSALLLCLALPQSHPGIPSTITDLYIVEFTHADVGFNAPPSVMEQRNHDRTVEALDLADTYANFHWTIETGYQLKGFLERASQQDFQRLKDRLRERRFVFGANYTNLHSSVVGEEQYNRLTYPSAEYANLLEVRPRTAFLNDVPGFTLATPRVLAQSGVEFALLGPNDFVGGKPVIPLQDRPFWWIGKNGYKTLTWITYGSYAEGFVEWGLLNLATAFPKVSARLAEYEAAGYPYDSILIARAFDDTIPNTGMLWLVQQWNLTYATPKMRLATVDEFFDHLLNKYGDVFPSYYGDASGPWDDINSITPVSAGKVRQARTVLPEVESLWSLLHLVSGVVYPAAALDEAWRLSMTFDEHSSGGMGWPGLLTEAEVVQENEEFVDMALRCEELTRSAETEAMNLMATKFVPQGESGLVVANILGKEWHGVLEIEFEHPQPADLRLADPAGGPDADFRWTAADRSGLAFRTILPAHSIRRWQITDGGQAPSPPTWLAGNSMTVGHHQLTLDPLTGTAVQLLDLNAQFDWLQTSQPHIWAGFEEGLNLEVFFSIWNAINPSPVTIQIEEPGPVYRKAQVYHSSGLLLREYRLYEDEARMDLELSVRRSALPFVPYDDHSQHYGVSFPANLMTPTELYLDGPDGWYRPGADSLPEAGLGHFGASTAARLEGAEGRWMMVTAVHSGTFDLGSMTGANITSLEDQETTLTCKFIRHADLGLVSNGQEVPIEAEPGLPDAMPFEYFVRFGTQPLADHKRDVLRKDLAPPRYKVVVSGQGQTSSAAVVQAFDLQGPAHLVSLKRAQTGDGYVLRLRSESTGTSVLTWPGNFSSAWEASLVEEPLQQLQAQQQALSIPLQADAVFTLLLLD